MIRAIRARVVLFSAISLLLALGVATMLGAPIAVAATAYASKQVKRHKKSKKKSTKKVASVKVTAGTETLTFSTQAAQALEKANVTVAAVGPTTGTLASGFAFPLAGGTLNPASGVGSLTTIGALTFSTGVGVPGFSLGREATVAEPSLSLYSVSAFSFTSQQATPPKFSFATVALKDVHPLENGSAITLTSLRISLTSSGARFLNEFVGSAFKTGETVGSVTVQVTASS